MTEDGGAVKLLETIGLGSAELKESGCGADVGASNAENLPLRFSFTVGGEGAAMV